MGHRRNQGKNKLLESNDSASTIYQNLWVTVKAVLRERLTPVNIHIRKTLSPNK